MASLGGNLDSVRRGNLAGVLRLVHESRGIARSRITAATGLNRSTVAALVAELAAHELVVEAQPSPPAGAGRPSRSVLPHPGPVAIAVGPELDAVTIAAVGLGARVEHRARHVVDRALRPDEAVALISGLVADLRDGPLAGRDVLGAGLAVPGLVRAEDDLVRWAPHLDWVDEPVAARISAEIGLPVRAGNDAGLGARAEHTFGAGRGIDDLVYLNGGASGIGGGVIAGGRPLGGTGGYAGEFGQNRPGAVDPADRVTAGGTLEDEVSRARLLAAVGLEVADEDELRVALLGSRDPAVTEELARQRRILSAAISSAANVLNPRLVVLGGFLATIRAADPAPFDELVRSQTVRATWEQTTIRPAELGADLLMIGAAELVFDGLLADPLAGRGASHPRDLGIRGDRAARGA